MSIKFGHDQYMEHEKKLEINSGCKIYGDKGGLKSYHYEEMLKRLNDMDDKLSKVDSNAEFSSTGILLRKLWRKYEKNLMVHKRNLYGGTHEQDIKSKNIKKTEYIGFAKDNGEYGVYTDLVYDTYQKDWSKAYQLTFHGFFSHIDYLISPNDDEYFSYAYCGNNFCFIESGKIPFIKAIEEDVKKINPSDLLDLPLHDKAPLYDIMGGVLSKDKYIDRNNKQFGHNSDYWVGNGGKDADSFYKLLCTDTFAHMASSAIVNPHAFKLLKDNLPNAYRMFQNMIDVASKSIEIFFIIKNKSVEKVQFPIVIDRYKMPGLNRNGTDIADDMCYGFGKKQNLPIYTQGELDKYKKEYEKNGFDKEKKLYKKFANMDENISSKSIYKSGDIPRLAYFIKNMNKSIRLYSIFQKIIDLYKVGFNEDELLFTEFIRMVHNFFVPSKGSMRDNIDKMIYKFKNNEGGIYENSALTKNVENHPSTERYCEQLEEYMNKKLKTHNGEISKLEDKEVDWADKKSEITKRKRKENKGKDFSLTPMYDGSIKKPEKFSNIFNGLGIALGDIWATEVKIIEYDINGTEYKGKYQVTLWDHFGLDVDDIEILKPAGWFDGFIAWFLLQHFRGYRPFITKITFTKPFEGTIRR